MKEIRYFYAPELESLQELPHDEAAHCVRVLRLQTGDEIHLTDGKGLFCRAVITTVTSKRCAFEIKEKKCLEPEWKGMVSLAVAPTKNMDRMEWLAEKATEIGLDNLVFLNCRNSERRIVKTERVEKIVVSAMKQSHKAYKPTVTEMTDFQTFVKQSVSGQKFIAHCYDESDVAGDEKQEESKRMTAGKPFLMDVLDANQDAVVLVGPEGDFSIEEVRFALRHGYQSVSLGKSRLRTETAALVAVHLMHIAHSCDE